MTSSLRAGKCHDGIVADRHTQSPPYYYILNLSSKFGFPGSREVGIPRSHRGGRGSIPRLGRSFSLFSRHFLKFDFCEKVKIEGFFSF